MSMNALGVIGVGDASAIQHLQLPIPTVGADDLLVKIHGFSINPVDTKVRRGSFPVLTDETKVTGWDASGVVEAVGSNVTNFKVGDEVFYAGALNRQGTSAQFSAVDHRLVALKPKSVDHTTASSMPLTALTALEAFLDSFRIPLPKDANDNVNASQTLLVVAGAGGAGAVAIQLAKSVFKFGKVVATARRSESIDFVRKMGADVVLDGSKDWKAQLEENGINGVNYVYVCSEIDDYFDTLVSIVLPFGRIACIVPAQRPINLMALFGKSISFSWEYMATRPINGYDLQRQGDLLAQFASFVDAGMIKHWIGTKFDTATAETLRDGHILQESGKAVGKIAYTANFA